MTRWAALLLALAITGAGCGDAAPADGEGIRVVATTTILGDLARNLVGTAGTVEVLLPIGADPHEYQPSSRQAATAQQADLVIGNGLGLEPGLTDVLAAANTIEVAGLLDPIDGDPHVWLDPIRMAQAARLIGEELERAAPGGAWVERADTYARELEAVDGQVRDILAAVPADRRLLVTNHDTLRYFAARYGFDVLGVVIPGGATLAEPSSAELGALVEEISRRGVPAIFAETTEPAALAEAVAAEAGEDIAVVELFTGSLGEPGSGAETLIAMLLTNAARIATALS